MFREVKKVIAFNKCQYCGVYDGQYHGPNCSKRVDNDNDQGNTSGHQDDDKGMVDRINPDADSGRSSLSP